MHFDPKLDRLGNICEKAGRYLFLKTSSFFFNKYWSWKKFFFFDFCDFFFFGMKFFFFLAFKKILKNSRKIFHTSWWLIKIKRFLFFIIFISKLSKKKQIKMKFQKYFFFIIINFDIFFLKFNLNKTLIAFFASFEARKIA